MSKRILIVKNNSSEGPGLLEEIIRGKKNLFSIIDLDSGDRLPDEISDIGAVVILGGPDSANDHTQKIVTEISFIQKILSADIPYLGICLGLQLMVVAMGGKVIKNKIKEVGFRDPEDKFYTIHLTKDNREDPLFNHLGNELKVFHLHGETVELLPAMQLIATGKFCRNQVVKIGSNIYGIQSHFELTREMLENWIINDPDLAKLDPIELRKDFESIRNDYINTGETLMTNFLTLAKF